MANNKFEVLPELQDTIDALKTFNAWRRGAEIPQPSPSLIGMHLDIAIKALEQLTPENQVKNA